jgi:hypothetical protein
MEKKDMRYLIETKLGSKLTDEDFSRISAIHSNIPSLTTDDVIEMYKQLPKDVFYNLYCASIVTRMNANKDIVTLRDENEKLLSDNIKYSHRIEELEVELNTIKSYYQLQ